jgi:hypothetical protein
MPGQGRFTVRVDEELLRELETRNMGRPVALDAVIVCVTGMIIMLEGEADILRKMPSRRKR